MVTELWDNIEQDKADRGKINRIEKLASLARLLDTYGCLLTQRQAEALTMFYEEDLSLAEIAAQIGASRQAAHDLIHRGEAQLMRYELLLGINAAQDKRQKLLTRLSQQISNSSLLPEEQQPLIELIQALETENEYVSSQR